MSNGTHAAFITYAHEFQHNWAIFSQILKRRPDLKIANNFHSNDNFGVREMGLWFQSGVHERYRRRFVGRMDTIISSGIYGLWNKWHRIRFSAAGTEAEDVQKHKPANGVPGDPISFDNSALFWIFWAQSLCWLAAFAIFWLEVIWPCLWLAMNLWRNSLGEACANLKYRAIGLVVSWILVCLSPKSIS